jgi:hypothetical protein
VARAVARAIVRVVTLIALIAGAVVLVGTRIVVLGLPAFAWSARRS